MSFFKKMKNSVKKTIDNPIRILTKPVEELAVRPGRDTIQQLSSFASSDLVGSTIGEAINLASTDLGQMGLSGIGASFGIPNLGGFFAPSSQPSPQQVAQPLPTQGVSYAQAPINPIILIIGGGALIGLIILTRK